MPDPNPTCVRCLHEWSLHWRPGCNAVGCRCRKFTPKETT